MKKLLHNQAGAGHVLLIVAFVVALLGIVGFTYTRISEKNAATSSETQPAEAGENVASNQDDEAANTADDDEGDTVAQEGDPTDDLGDDPVTN